MTAAGLLLGLRARGITVEARGDRLRVTPADRLLPEDLDHLRARKGDLLHLLADLASLEADGTAAGWRTLYERLPERDQQRLAEEVAAADPLGCLLALCLDVPMVVATTVARGAA